MAKKLEQYRWIAAKLEQYRWLAAANAYRSRLFSRPVDLVVLHSGEKSPNVAEYIASMPDGRSVSAHFSWHGGLGQFVQQVDLDREAWHVGGSSFLGDRYPNKRSFGIELPGPWNSKRDDGQLDQLRLLLEALRPLVTGEAWLTGHEFIDYGKRDPGPGLSEERVLKLAPGYRAVWHRCRNNLTRP